MTKRAVGAFGLMMVLLAGCNDDPGLHPATTIPPQSSVGGGPGPSVSTTMLTGMQPDVDQSTTTSSTSPRWSTGPTSRVPSSSSMAVGPTNVTLATAFTASEALPRPTPPVPRPKLSSQPPPMVDTRAGAIDFAIWYASLIQVTFEQRSTALLEHYSLRECEACWFSIDNLKKQLASGMSYSADPVWHAVLEYRSIQSGAEVALYRFRAAAELSDSSGQIVTRTEATVDRLAYRLVWSNSEWRVAAAIPVVQG